MAAYYEYGVMAKKPAWHNLGTVVYDKDALTAAEVMTYEPRLASKVFGVPFSSIVPRKVDGKMVYLRDQNGNVLLDDNGNPVPEMETVVNTTKMQTIREFDNRILGVVGKDYTILQNTEAFDFIDSLVDDGEAHYDTVGSLYDGSVIWLLARLPQAIKIAGMDSELANRYILLRNSHDGSTSIEVMATLVRVVCANTLSCARAGAPNKLKVRHTKNRNMKIADARRVLDMTFAYDEALDLTAQKMLDVKFSDAEWHKLVETLVPTKESNGDEKTGRGLTVATKTHDALDDLYFHSDNLGETKGTAWGALNAIIEYNDHGIVGRETEAATSDENRFMRIINRPPTSILSRAEAILIPA